MTTLLYLMFAALAVGIAAWLYASPHLAIRHLRQAALADDVDGVMENVDLPAFRASLKEALKGKGSTNAVEAFAALGLALVSGLLNIGVDLFLTPQVIVSMAKGGDELDASVSGGYESFSRFCVRISPARAKIVVTLVFLRSKMVHWRLSGIRFQMTN